MLGNKRSVTDSRRIAWVAHITGPTRAGNLKPGQSIDGLPEIYFARYTREGVTGREITLDALTPDLTDSELLDMLEASSEWHDEWARE